MKEDTGKNKIKSWNPACNEDPCLNSPEKHISQVCTKTSRMIYWSPIYKDRNTSFQRHLYHLQSFTILPHLTYCDLVWHFFRASGEERGLWTSLLRSYHASTYSDLLARAGMTSLFNTRLQEIAIFIFKIKNNFLFTNILELFPRLQVDYSWEYNLRNLDFYFPKSKICCVRKTLT